MSREIEEIYKTTISSKRPYVVKNNFHKPVFAEENYPIVNKNTNSYIMN